MQSCLSEIRGWDDELGNALKESLRYLVHQVGGALLWRLDVGLGVVQGNVLGSHHVLQRVQQPVIHQYLGEDPGVHLEVVHREDLQNHQTKSCLFCCATRARPLTPLSILGVLLQGLSAHRVVVGLGGLLHVLADPRRLHARVLLSLEQIVVLLGDDLHLLGRE